MKSNTCIRNKHLRIKVGNLSCIRELKQTGVFYYCKPEYENKKGYNISATYYGYKFVREK